MDWMTGAGLGAGGAQIGSGLLGLFGGNKNPPTNPADTANSYLNQIPDILKQYYQPWMNAGTNAQGKSSGVYDEMTSNPNDYYNKIASGYKESPGYQFKLNQGLQASNNAARAGGMAGSLQHQQQSNQIGNDIASQDFNDYLSQVLGINKTGLQGEENAMTRGYDASKGLGEGLGSNIAQQAGYGYQGQAGRNAWEAQQGENQKGSLENIFKGIGTALPYLFF